MKWKFMLLIVSSFMYGSAQNTILTKKDMEARLEQIQAEIKGKNYENALGLLKSKSEVILEENVPKKWLEPYAEMKRVLQEKEELFIKNKLIVEDFERKYSAEQFCETTGLLELQYDTENSFKETRDKLSLIRPKYEQCKATCDKNKQTILEWKKDYNAGNYEKLFRDASVDRADQSRMYKEDLSDYLTLKQNLHIKQNSYKTVEKKLVIRPTELMGNISYETLSYEQAKKFLAELEEVLTYDTELQKLEGSHPELDKDFEKTKVKIKNAIARLNESMETSRPLSAIELYSIANSSQPVSLGFIKGKFEKIENLGGSSFNDNKLFYLYEKDVMNYYHDELSYLASYEQKEAYRGTEEFSKKELELAMLKEKMFQTVYYVEHGVKSALYDASTKKLKVPISTDKGNAVAEAHPPKCVKRIDLSKLEFITEQNATGSKEDFLMLSVDPSKAAEIENHSGETVLLFIFKLTERVEKEYKFSTPEGESWKIKDPVFVPSFLRVVVANKNDGTYYYDQLFRFE